MNMNNLKIITIAILVSFISVINLSFTVNALDVVLKTDSMYSNTSEIRTPPIAFSQIKTINKSPLTVFMNNIIGTIVVIVSVSYATSIYVQSHRRPGRDKNRS